LAILNHDYYICNHAIYVMLLSGLVYLWSTINRHIPTTPRNCHSQLNPNSSTPSSTTTCQNSTKMYSSTTLKINSQWLLNYACGKKYRLFRITVHTFNLICSFVGRSRSARATFDRWRAIKKRIMNNRMQSWSRYVNWWGTWEILTTNVRIFC